MRSHTRQHRCLAVLSVLVAMFSGGALAQTLLPGTTRFVDFIELTDHDDYVDIDVQFTCSLRYVTQLPASEGTELRIELRPTPDCGTALNGEVAGELPPVSGADGILNAARVESDIPGQLSLVLQWKHRETFVLAQGADLHSMRIRLIGRRRGRIIVAAPVDVVSDFALNLDSQLKPFAPADLTAASQRLGIPAYVSEVTVEDQRWYRLRVGPIAYRSDAAALLSKALPYYPRAWLAIGDDTATTAAAAPDVAVAAGGRVERIGADAALSPAARQALSSAALQQLVRHNYAQAIKLLTKLQRQPEYPGRAAAQELLGVAYERSGELAQAKAEYEEYLYRYPHGAAADRVRERLRVLASANGMPRTLNSSSSAPPAWSVTGGVGQLFRYDGTSVLSSVSPAAGSTSGAMSESSSSASSSQDALYTDVDVLARRRADRFGVVARFAGGYDRDFSGAIPPDEKRVSIASIDLTDAKTGLLLRVGRQVRNEGGVLGTFDGALLAWQWTPSWNVNATYGFPVEQINQGVKTDRPFEALSVAFTPPGKPWDGSVFATEQQFDGFRDREAVGMNLHYLARRGTLAALADYDIYYHLLNAAALLGTLQLPARWVLSVDAEQRNAPVLTTRNALIGQPDTSLIQLEQVFTPAQILQLARDRTADSSDFALTATRPLGERFQLAATATADRIGATPASGGVPATPSTGLESTYQLQLYASSLWSLGDFDVVSLSHADTEIGRIDDAGITSRFPLWGAWRLGPRFTVEHRLLSEDGSHELDFLPSFLLDYQRRRWLLQFEIGGEIGSRDALLQSQDTHRYYVSLAYRVAF